MWNFTKQRIGDKVIIRAEAKIDDLVESLNKLNVYTYYDDTFKTQMVRLAAEDVYPVVRERLLSSEGMTALLNDIRIYLARRVMNDKD